MIFSIPLELIGTASNSRVTIAMPLYGFKNTYPIDNKLITFEFDISPKPQKLILTFHTDDNSKCIVMQPAIDSALHKNVPVRTISLKKNNTEISVPIENLREEWNYRSWSNPWLTNNESITYRYYWDYNAVANMQS